MFEKVFRCSKFKICVFLSICMLFLTTSLVESIESSKNETSSPLNSSSSSNTTASKFKRQLSACYSNPCNYGTCYDVALAQLSVTGFYCVCSAGYTGTQCEKEINECLSNPCKNGAQCLDLVGSFFCSCQTGYSGVLCENPTSRKICPDNACGDGECVLTTHPTYQYACKCKDNSYKFEPCSSISTTNKCTSQPCGSSLCIEAPNSPTGYVCQCGTNDFRTNNCQAVATSCQTNSCFNGGTCVAYNVNERWCNSIQAGQSCCQCVTGYTGFRCETEINECVSNPCQNGGLCDNLVNAYKCSCPLGFTGTNCEQLQGCKNNPCKFGGTCTVSTDGSEVCQCKDGFSGTYCEIDINECLSSPCQNGGTCIDLENSYACYCPDGYFRPTFCPAQSIGTTTKGSAISTTTTSSPGLSSLCPNQDVCKNNGVCRIIGSTFICVCPEGYYGSLCELYSSAVATVGVAVGAQAITSCTPNPCQFYGTCVSYTTGGFYGCVCQIGYTGTYCQNPPVDATTTVAPSNQCVPNPCFNGGICILSSSGQFSGCFCPSSVFSGYYCQNYSPLATTSVTPTFNCFPNPCFNGGICTTKGCICGSGYSGQYCETLNTAALCSNIKCQNNGICNVVLKSSVPTAECWCLKGYSGFYCEISTVSGASRCSQVQCLNNGTCAESLSGLTTTAYCTCKPGYTGSRCETEYFRCTKDGIFTDTYGCANGRYLECVYFGQSSVGLSNGILFRRDCPPGLRFNQQFGYCDYAINVNCPTV